MHRKEKIHTCICHTQCLHGRAILACGKTSKARVRPWIQVQFLGTFSSRCSLFARVHHGSRLYLTERTCSLDPKSRLLRKIINSLFTITN